MIPYRNAIASIESAGSGDYSAVGPDVRGDRAYGRYQVMGANIPEWTRNALGRAMTPEEFLASPEAQDAVFDTVFGGYVQRYGPAGAASMWFSGDPTPDGDSDGYTKDTAYVDRFMGALGQSPQNALSGMHGTDFNPNVYAERMNALMAALDEQDQQSQQQRQPMLHQSGAVDPRYAMRFFG